TPSVRSAAATPFATPTAPTVVTLSPGSAYAPAGLSGSWSGGSSGGGSTSNGTLWYDWNYTAGSSASANTVYANSGASISAGVGTYRFQVRACNPGGCSSYAASNQSTVSSPVWNVQVDNANTCAQRSSTSGGLDVGCASPNNVWIPANANLTVTCHVTWNVTVIDTYPSVFYYISTGTYSGFYVAQRTLGPTWDDPGYIPPGMPSC
ncbi:MAG: hypothetical protein Q8M65_09870, partial [Rhodoglobus sp.]|nr:hypothetical protein [Rhodoglobus sp.]